MSDNLPNTSYIKMVDIWMLFNLVLPFIEVILHTYTDLLREEEEDEEPRQINHHGKIIDVDTKKDKAKVIKVSPKDLVSVNEKLQQSAMKCYYDKYYYNISSHNTVCVAVELARLRS